MKSMQRLGGKMMKRSADQQDVGAIIASFRSVDEMLDRLIKDLKTWRDSWDDILRLQYNASEAFTNLYNPIEPTNSPEQRHAAAQTPPQAMQRCLAMQKMYSDMKADLQQEIDVITSKIMRPAEEAKKAMKALHKTLKHRENMKLDYERYLSRAEHARKKDTRTVKEDAAFAKHENDLAQAQIDYTTADDQVKQTFPPLTEAVISLLPYLLANHVMVQTTMVGQIYTSLDAYCKQQRLPSPAPGDAEIISAWDEQFTSFRKELEQGLQVLSGGKTIHQSMTVAEKNGSTITGLGIRNKSMGLVNRGKSSQTNLKPGGIGRTDSAGPAIAGASYEEEEEVAPPKPPRPDTMGSPSGVSSPAFSPAPGIPMGNKPRMLSYSNNVTPYDQKATSLMPGFANEKQPPPPYSESGVSSTPTSRYHTPTNGLSPNPSAAGNDYFGHAQEARRASAASSVASIAAAKKKPPPPVPAKRLPSYQTQFVTALFDFEGQNEGDLAFREGDKIRVVKKTDSTDDWWDGELRGRTGSFPANYVQL